MSKTRGEIVWDYLRDNKVNRAKLAKFLGFSRQNLTAYYHKPIPDSLMLKIGEYTHHDFSEEFPELKKYMQSAEPVEGYKNQTPKEQMAELEHKVKELEKDAERYKERIGWEQDKVVLVERERDIVKALNKRIESENKQLRKLLDEHGISWKLKGEVIQKPKAQKKAKRADNK